MGNETEDKAKSEVTDKAKSGATDKAKSGTEQESPDNFGYIDWDHFDSFVEEFSAESDRAAVILGAAKLDLLLYQILEKVLRPTTSGKDELLDGDSPLATFSSRINMTFRLGVINDQFARALHLVRRIRNSFAHELTGSSLATGSHRDRVRELMVPFLGTDIVRRLVEVKFSGKSGPAVDFRVVLAVMAARLEVVYLGVKPIEMKAWQLVTEGMRDMGDSED